MSDRFCVGNVTAKASLELVHGRLVLLVSAAATVYQ